MEPSRSTIKRLFAVTRNRCAFPDCTVPIVAESGTVTGIVCHIRARSRGGPRFDAKQTDEQRHAFENLILMCAVHSKVIDSEPRRYTVALLQKLKSKHEQPAENELSVADGRKVDLLVTAYRDTYINANKVLIERLTAKNVIFPKAKDPAIAAPSGSIGADLLMRNYAWHLIERYNEFASKQPGRTNFTFAAIHSSIRKRYSVGKWELVPASRFNDLCEMLQSKIDRTFLGKRNRSKGYKSYSTLDEFRAGKVL